MTVRDKGTKNKQTTKCYTIKKPYNRFFVNKESNKVNNWQQIIIFSLSDKSLPKVVDEGKPFVFGLQKVRL